MYVMDILNPDFVIPFLIFSIPIIAIVGGITAGIVRAVGQQRLMELAQRERIAAIERGIDPARLPPPAALMGADPMFATAAEQSRRLGQGLMIGGCVLLAVGVSLAVFLAAVEPHKNIWTVGLIPGAVGIALLVSSWLVGRGVGNGGSTAS